MLLRIFILMLIGLGAAQAEIKIFTLVSKVNTGKLLDPVKVYSYRFKILFDPEQEYELGAPQGPYPHGRDGRIFYTYPISGILLSGGVQFQENENEVPKKLLFKGSSELEHLPLLNSVAIAVVQRGKPFPAADIETLLKMGADAHFSGNVFVRFAVQLGGESLNLNHQVLLNMTVAPGSEPNFFKIVDLNLPKDVHSGPQSLAILDLHVFKDNEWQHVIPIPFNPMKCGFLLNQERSEE